MADIPAQTERVKGFLSWKNYATTGSGAVTSQGSSQPDFMVRFTSSSGVLRKKPGKPGAWLPPSAYAADRRGFTYPDASGFTQNTAGVYTQRSYGTQQPPYVQPQLDMLPLPSALHYQAVNNVLDQKVSLGVELAELNKTIGLVGETATNIATGIRRFRRGNFSGAAEAIGLRKPTSNWLQYRYGWTPLLLSVKDQVELAQNGLGDARFGVTVERQTREERIIETAQTKWQEVFDTRQKLRYDFNLRSPGSLALARLGLLNPLEIAWELVPFSFVVDWFVPIGDALAELTLRALYDFKGGSYTCYRRVNAKCLGRHWVRANGTYVVYTGGGATYFRRRMQRTPYDKLPFGLKLSVRPNITPQRALDGIALLKQAISR